MHTHIISPTHLTGARIVGTHEHDGGPDGDVQRYLAIRVPGCRETLSVSDADVLVGDAHQAWAHWIREQRPEAALRFDALDPATLLVEVWEAAVDVGAGADRTLTAEARADAITATVRQILELDHPEGVGPIHPYRLADAMIALSEATAGDEDPRIRARAATLRQLAVAVRTTVIVQGWGSDWPDPQQRPMVEQAAPWWTAQIAAWADSEDPREAAMAMTAARELALLGELWAGR